MSVRDLEEVVALIQQHTRLDRPVDDPSWPPDEPLRIGFSRVDLDVPMQIYQYDPPEEDTIRYVLVHARAEIPKTRRFWFVENDVLRPRDERVHIAATNVLFFERNGGVFAALFTQNENWLNILKTELFREEWWGDLIGATEYQVGSEFFYWIVRTRMEQDGRVSPQLTVMEVSGFDSHTADDFHTMKGQGDGIYEILSTLGVIFSNDPMDALTMDIDHGQDSITFRFDRHGGVRFSELQYDGTYVGETTGDMRKGLMVAYVYLKLIPALLARYGQAARNWTPAMQDQFIRRVGKVIVRKIARKLDWQLDRNLRNLLDDVD
jgi:hypothetical protein